MVVTNVMTIEGRWTGATLTTFDHTLSNMATNNDRPGDRLRALRDERAMTIRDVAKESEGAFSHSYVSQLEKGIAPWGKVSLTVIRGFARAFGMGIDDLLEAVDGKGNARRADDLVTDRRVPVLEMVGAGEPLDGGDVIDHVDIPLTWRGEYVAYQIDGDSMSPRIPPGAQVIVKRTASARAGDVIVCYVADEGMLCKQLHSIEPDGTWVLGSANPNYPPIYSRDVTVMGVVQQVRIDL